MAWDKRSARSFGARASECGMRQCGSTTPGTRGEGGAHGHTFQGRGGSGGITSRRHRAHHASSSPPRHHYSHLPQPLQLHGPPPPPPLQPRLIRSLVHLYRDPHKIHLCPHGMSSSSSRVAISGGKPAHSTLYSTVPAGTPVRPGTSPLSATILPIRITRSISRTSRPCAPTPSRGASRQTVLELSRPLPLSSPSLIRMAYNRICLPYAIHAPLARPPH